MKIKNQQGLAALEVVIVAAIVAIFATIAVPKMARIMDAVQLSYETKRLYSEINFANSFHNLTNFYPGIFNDSIIPDDSRAIKLTTSVKSNKYSLSRTSTSFDTKIRDDHFLEGGIKISHNVDKMKSIIFTPNGPQYAVGGAVSGRFILTSKFGKRSIRIDSVGRVTIKDENQK